MLSLSPGVPRVADNPVGDRSSQIVPHSHHPVVNCSIEGPTVDCRVVNACLVIHKRAPSIKVEGGGPDRDGPDHDFFLGQCVRSGLEGFWKHADQVVSKTGKLNDVTWSCGVQNGAADTSNRRRAIDRGREGIRFKKD